MYEMHQTAYASFTALYNQVQIVLRYRINKREFNRDGAFDLCRIRNDHCPLHYLIKYDKFACRSI